MKKLRLFAVLYILTNVAFGQKEEISMKAILSDAGGYAQKIEMEMGQEIVRMEFDILQTSKESYRVLVDKYEYGIFAFGDYRIADIDIKIYKWVNNQWNLITKDQDANPNAVVTIKPSYSGEYKIVISAYKFTEGYDIGHYGLIVFHN